MAYRVIITDRAEELLDQLVNYILIFRIEGDTVYVLGIFHQLENYKNKL
jgi:hypothetical protein